MKIGVLSDTHGYFNPKILTIFKGVDHILHAGDIGNEDVITILETIAPVKAVHGNIDTHPINSKYPLVLTTEFHGVFNCVIHQFTNLKNPFLQTATAKSSKKKIDLLIYGHTHHAKLEREGDILLFNPGAAGRERVSNYATVGLLSISENGNVQPEIINLLE